MPATRKKAAVTSETSNWPKCSTETRSRRAATRGKPFHHKEKVLIMPPMTFLVLAGKPFG